MVFFRAIRPKRPTSCNGRRTVCLEIVIPCSDRSSTFTDGADFRWSVLILRDPHLLKSCVFDFDQGYFQYILFFIFSYNGIN